MAEVSDKLKRRYKSRMEHKNSIISYFRNKRRIISDNIYKYKKDITQELKEYKKKNDFNITLYKKQSKSSKDFNKMYSLIRKNQKKKEKDLDIINNIINDYLLKKKMKVDKQDMKENIFDLSSLIEPNLTRLEMDYLFNYKRIINEIKENESLKDNIDEFRRTMYPNKRKGNYFNNKIPIRNKILSQINCLNDVKLMKRMNLMAKSKMIDNDLIKEEFIIRKIRHKIKEAKKNGKIEDILNYKKSVKNSLIDIDKIKKQLKQYEENNKNVNNLGSKTTRDDKNKSLFYIPTIVKSFPELLYDKLNKNKDISNRTKNKTTNDSTSRTLMRKKGKSSTERINYRKKSDEDNSINKAKYNILENINKEISRKIKFKKNTMNERIIINKNLNRTMREFNHRKESMSETAKVYNRILNMSTYDKNSKENEIFMKTFLKERNYMFINSINEKKPKNYFNSLKNIHSQFSTDRKTKLLYDANNLLENKKSKKILNELSNFRNTLRQNENLLIKSLLIEKE